MKAWLLKNISDLSQPGEPLCLSEVDVPVPQDYEILLRISCCGVCHTEIDEIEGRTPPPAYLVIPGHQVVGSVEERGRLARQFEKGDRVGVGWIYSACGECEYCKRGLENLCSEFKATGRDCDGGYAAYMVVQEKFAFSIPSVFSDIEAAPLLCAGSIGFRSLKLTNLVNGQPLGLCGFGASGHLVLKMARYLYPASPIYVFARNREERQFSLNLDAQWAGDITERPPERLQAIIDTTPVWSTVLGSLLQLRPGGRLVINAIRKETGDIGQLIHTSYQDHLWMEKEIKTVANIARADIREFLDLAAKIPIRPVVEKYAFNDANKALLDIKQKNIKGAKVLVM